MKAHFVRGVITLNKNIDTTLFKHLINASKIIHDQVFKDIKKYGLTYENLMVLECLYHHGPHYIQVLSDKLYIPSGSITYIVNKLEKKSLVRREIQSDNKRYCKVFITDEGEALFTKVDAIYTDNIELSFSNLSTNRKKEINTALKQICQKEE